MSTLQDQTSQPAQTLPAFDPTSAITNLEQSLLGSLGAPIHQALGGLPLQQFAGSSGGQPANLGGLANQIDPFNLITPVINGLGTLGNGQFSGIDPTQILSGISNVFDGTATPLQQAGNAVDWQGQSGAAAKGKTQAALANGAEVANQADALGTNLSTATANVAQAKQQLIEIIDEYQAKMAAADLSTPAGKRAAVAAANQANTEATAVMQELQGNLGSQAQQVSAMGTPVGVTQAGGSMLGGPLGSMVASLDPTGSLGTVLSDPRLNPRSLAGNFMDLLFMPQTMSQLSQEMAQTNTIMTGLGNTLTTTNRTIGHTNSIMTGLGNTLGTTNRRLEPLPGALSQATNAMYQTTGAVGQLHGDIAGKGGLEQSMGDLHSDISDPKAGLNHKLDSVGQKMDNVGGKVEHLDRKIPHVPGLPKLPPILPDPPDPKKYPY